MAILDQIAQMPISLLSAGITLGGLVAAYVSSDFSRRHQWWRWLLTVVQIVLCCLYNVTLHPLSKYPGPLSAKFSNWRDVLVAAKGDKHLDLYRLHQQYGEY